MSRGERVEAILWICALLALAAAVLLPGFARAEEPVLAIRLAGGGSAVYAVSQINEVAFGGDSLMVVGVEGADRYTLQAINRIEFLWGFSSVKDPEDAAALMKALHLFQNQPNPFSPETRIRFELPQPGRLELGIYSPDGRLIRMLMEEDCSAGAHEVVWDGRDAAGQRVTGGVYFYKLVTPGIAESRRMILVP